MSYFIKIRSHYENARDHRQLLELHLKQVKWWHFYKRACLTYNLSIVKQEEKQYKHLLDLMGEKHYES